VREANEKHVFLSTGAGLQIAMDWTKRQEYADRAVYSMPLWSMAAKAVQAYQLHDYEDVVTVEDHLYDGGFGSWLLESVANRDGLADKVKIKALKSEVCGMVGSQAELNKVGGMFL
jgi:Deoxyxylulose-5-phosphate synthase